MNCFSLADGLVYLVHHVGILRSLISSFEYSTNEKRDHLVVPLDFNNFMCLIQRTALELSNRQIFICRLQILRNR